MYKVISLLTIVAIGNCQDYSFAFRENSGPRHSSRLQQNSEVRQNTELHQHSGFRQTPELRQSLEPPRNSNFGHTKPDRRSGIVQDSEFQLNSDYRHNPRLGQESESHQNSRYRHNPRLRQRTELEQRSELQQNSNLQQETGFRQSSKHRQNSEPQRNSAFQTSTELEESFNSRNDSDIRQNIRIRQNFEVKENSKDQTSPKQQETETKSQGRAPFYAPGKCPENQLLYPEGEVEWTCDCGPGYIYYAPADGCFSIYRRGPCPRGQHLVLKRNKYASECVSNPCKDGYARYNGKCYELGKANDPCPAPENGGGVLGVNRTTLVVECISGPDKLSLFDIPPNVEKCPPGSKRDSLKKCRQNWNTSR